MKKPKKNIAEQSNKLSNKKVKETTAKKEINKKFLSQLEKEIKRKEDYHKKLLENEERYRIISQITSDYMFAASFDKKSISLDWYSKTFEQEIGYPLENIFNFRYIRRYFYPDDLKLIIPIRNKLLKGENVEREVRIFNSDGEIVWINAKLFPVYDKKKKKVVKFYCAAQNITRRKKAELELKELNYELELRIQERTAQLENAVKNLQNEIAIRTETEQKLLETQKELQNFAESLDKKLQESEYKHLWNVFENSQFPTITFKDNSILNINNSFEKLTGYSVNEIKSINEFAELIINSEDKNKFYDSINQLNDFKKEISNEFKILTKDKKKKDIILIVNNFYHEGKNTGIIILEILDVTEQKRSTEIINTIAESVSSKTGQDFFDSLVNEIAKSIEADYVLIGTIDENDLRLINTISVYGEGNLIDNFSYNLNYTPCDNVFGKELCIYNKNVSALFPKDLMLKDLDIEAYAGIPLFDKSNTPLGILFALKKKPFDNLEFVKKILTIYSARASTEIFIKNTIDKLKASENKFAKAFYTSPDSININRLHDGLYIDVNDGFCKITGWQKEEVIGKTSSEINIWYDLNDRKILVEGLLKNGLVSNLHAIFRKKNGELVHGLMSATLIELNNEKCILNITRDITELKQKEKLLQESEERFKVLMETSPYSHVVIKNGYVLYANNSTLKLFKAKSLDNILGNNIFKYVHPDYLQFAKRKLKQIEKGLQKNESVEIKYICYDGSIIEVEVYARLFRYNNEEAILLVSNDVTDKKLAKERLRESEQRFKRLFEISPNALYLIENDKFILVNDALLKLLGAKSFEEIKDKNLFDFIHPDYRDIYLERKKQLANSKDFLPFIEYKLIKLDGSIVYAEVSSIQITFEGRNVIQTVARDITDWKIQQNSLKESQERFKLIVEHSPFAFAIHQNGKLIYANPATLKIINANSLDEIIGKSVIDFVHPDYRKFAIERIKQGAKDLKPLPPAEEKLLTIDGKEIIAEVSSIPFFLNGILSYQLIVQDITHFKKANENILKLSQAVEQSSSAVLITDKEGNIEYVNKRFEEITGYTLSEVLGKTPRILKSNYQTQEFYQHLWNEILKGNNFKSIIINKKKNGELYWELNSISSIKDNNGNITHFVAFKEDVTEQKRIEQELIKAKEEAEEAAKVRTHLLANLSHEFRTPLGSIIGYSSLLKEDAQDEDTKHIATQIEVSGRRLMKTFNELITLTELETDEFAINNTELDLTIFCSQIRILFETLALSKGLEIKTNIIPDQLITFIDENILTKIAGYIIDNAIKFTDKGEIVIHLDEPFVKENKKYVKLKISDSGKGIKQDELNLIFKEFRQISEGIRRDFEGLGLGLTLASRLSKLIDVEIELESEFQKGSTFTLIIPIKDQDIIKNEFIQKISPHDELNKETTPIDILVVEDNPLNIEILHKVFAKTAKIISARDGRTAINLAKENNFDVMLIDINLGYGIDGIEVLNQIRNFEHHKNTPAIALTAYASEMSKKEFLQKGFSDFISKPFEKKILIDLVHHLTKKI